jgi:hypothetical protein
MQELQYEPSAVARPIIVEHDRGTTRIEVLMPSALLRLDGFSPALSLTSARVSSILSHLKHGDLRS